MLVAVLRANVRVGFAGDSRSALRGVSIIEQEAIRLESFGDAGELKDFSFLGHAQCTEAVEHGEALFLDQIVDRGVELSPDFGTGGVRLFVR